jgi:hypothetical protein
MLGIKIAVVSIAVLALGAVGAFAATSSSVDGTQQRAAPLSPMGQFLHNEVTQSADIITVTNKLRLVMTFSQRLIILIR